jgi:5-methylcytosine-specific restriction protein A
MGVLCERPFCEDCGGFANEVHHIVKLRDGGTHDPSNLLALCKPCHQKRTARGE